MFSTLEKLKGAKQLIYAVLIGTAVIAFWRGAWNLMDYYILPEMPVASAWLTIAAGILILILTHKITKELM